MKKMVQFSAMLLAGTMMLPCMASCTSSDGEDGTKNLTVTTSVSTTSAGSSKPTVTTGGGLSFTRPAEGASASEISEFYGQIAIELMENINDTYYKKRMHSLRGEPKSSDRATVWGYAAFLEALADCYRIYPNNKKLKEIYVDAMTTGLSAYRVQGSLTTPAGTFEDIVYYNAGAGGSGDYYYDDNAWICYQLLNAYDLLKDESYLTKAEELLEFFKTGWDDTLGGGIYWDKGFGGKNTCSDGPISICFLWAYQMTKKDDYLTWGTKIYEWMYDTLCDKDSKLYCDNINNSGEISSWKADYNQGTPIYAGSLLYQITQDEKYLNQAKETAEAALGLAFKKTGSGKRLNVYMNGNPIYKSWCVGWLMRGFAALVSVTGEKGDYFTYMESVLTKTFKTRNDDGFYDPYFCSGDWKSESVTDVLQPCGVCSVIAICAWYERDIAPSAKN